MKKFINSYIDDIFKSYQWYRKRKGGKWYKYYDPTWGGGMMSGIGGWTQSVDEIQGAEIVDEEDWPQY